MENLYDELFNSQENLINAWKNNLNSVNDKEDFIDHFTKIEKLNKKLRDEFYRSTFEMVKSMEVFFPDEEKIWESERLAHKEIFNNPLDLFFEISKEYSFYKLINELFEKDIEKTKDAFNNLKKDYVKYIKKYLILISAKGFKDIYRNYIEILKKSNNLMESIMTPISEAVSVSEYKKSLNNPENLRKNKKKLLNSVNKLNEIDFKDFYKDSVYSQEKTVKKVERFSDVTLSYYDEMFNYIRFAIERSSYDYKLIESRLTEKTFEEYYIFMKKRIEFYLEEDIKSQNFKNLLSYTIDETVIFLNDEEDEINKLKEEIRILKEKLNNLEKEKS